MVLIITIGITAWIILSGFFLITVCMMSSVANKTELLSDDQLPRRSLRTEDGSADDVTTQPQAGAHTW